jgi:hypothetical protein
LYSYMFSSQMQWLRRLCTCIYILSLYVYIYTCICIHPSIQIWYLTIESLSLYIYIYITLYNNISNITKQCLKNNHPPPRSVLFGTSGAHHCKST